MKLPKWFNWHSLTSSLAGLHRKSLRKYRSYTDTYLKKRTLRRVERFVFSWIMLFVLAVMLVWQQGSQLSPHYLEDGQLAGGQFIEGIVGGGVETINPLFSGDRVSRSVQALIFSALFKYDGNGEVVHDLATGHTLSDDETVYTVSLREDAYWHDDEPVTARDVAFTFNTIRNPDTGSSLQLNWQGIAVEATDDYTVKFTLPNPYAPFLTQLTTGIVPAHLLAEVEPDRLRVTGFNQEPIGSGPFVLNEITGNEQIRLSANERYYDGRPQLDQLVISIYPDTDSMVSAYNKGELSSMVVGSELNFDAIDNHERTSIQRINLTSQAFAFYNTKRITDVHVRRALTRGLNTAEIIATLDGSHDTAASPLLPEHLGYKPSQLKFDREAALALFKQAGWELDDGELQKDGESLELELVTQASQEYVKAAGSIAEQWRQLGINVTVNEVETLNLQQDYIRPRNFDVLLFGIGLGSDPDVYAYWHSSQSEDVGRNLSQYESAVADLGLEDGRTRTDSRLRAAKYETFQDRWRADAPAAALYRLHNYYVFRKEAQGIDVADIAHTADRFYNVEDWTIQTQPVLRRLR